MALSNPMISPFLGPMQATQPPDTAGVGGFQGPPKSPEEMQQRVSGWDSFLQILAKPEVGKSLTDFGMTLMGGRMPGETTGGQIARSYQTAQAGARERKRDELFTRMTEADIKGKEAGVRASDAQAGAVTAGTETPEEIAARKERAQLQNQQIQELMNRLRYENSPEQRKLLTDQLSAAIAQTRAQTRTVDANTTMIQQTTPTAGEVNDRIRTSAAEVRATEFNTDPTRMQQIHDAEVALREGQGAYYSNPTGRGRGLGSADMQRLAAERNALKARNPGWRDEDIDLAILDAMDGQDRLKDAATIIQNFGIMSQIAGNDPIAQQEMRSLLSAASASVKNSGLTDGGVMAQLRKGGAPPPAYSTPPPGASAAPPPTTTAPPPPSSGALPKAVKKTADGMSVVVQYPDGREETIPVAQATEMLNSGKLTR